MGRWQFNFTPEKLALCVRGFKDPKTLFAALEAVLPKYNITTIDRVAAFLAQCGHESADFTRLIEGLNYSAQGLATTWPTQYAIKGADGKAIKPYKPNPLAVQIARNPELIANHSYANRLGNGTPESGDGWRFRGRGALQTTGKENYQAFAKRIGKTLDETVAYLETLPGAIESACWFWERGNLNKLADDRDVTSLSKAINGGYIGLEDRKTRTATNIKLLSS